MTDDLAWGNDDDGNDADGMNELCRMNSLITSSALNLTMPVW